MSGVKAAICLRTTKIHLDHGRRFGPYETFWGRIASEIIFRGETASPTDRRHVIPAPSSIQLILLLYSYSYDTYQISRDTRDKANNTNTNKSTSIRSKQGDKYPIPKTPYRTDESRNLRPNKKHTRMRIVS